jgi:hypothetical protein
VWRSQNGDMASCLPALEPRAKTGMRQEHSSISRTRIVGNTAMVASGFGIGLSGAVRDTLIEDNTVQGTRGANAIFSRPDRWNRPAKTKIIANKLVDCETSENGKAVIQALGDETVVRGNRATGGRYPALVWVDGADHVVDDNEGAGDARKYIVTKPAR